MKNTRLKEIVEIVAVISIVASLIFVGLQLMLDREIASTESVAKASDGRKQMAELIADNSGIWVNGLANNLQSDTDAIVFDSIAESFRMEFFGSWFRAGKLNHVEMDRFSIDYAKHLIGNPGLMAHWKRHVAWQEDLREYVGEGPGEFELSVERAIEFLQAR